MPYGNENLTELAGDAKLSERKQKKKLISENIYFNLKLTLRVFFNHDFVVLNKTLLLLSTKQRF